MGLADEVKRFFASEGPLSKALDGHEPRLGQLELALKVSESLESGGNLVAEAGTGTGKTLAYLVPAVLFAEANPNRHIFIATKTIVLQDQLLKKDIPLVRELLNPKRAIVSLKGRSNYLSLRRLKLAIEQPQLFQKTCAHGLQPLRPANAPILCLKRETLLGNWLKATGRTAGLQNAPITRTVFTSKQHAPRQKQES